MVEEECRALTAEIAGYRVELEELTTRMRRLALGLNAAQWQWQPARKEWSIAQCVEHMNNVSGLMLPRMRAAIASAQVEGRIAPGPFRYSGFDRFFVAMLEPSAPRWQRSQAPKLYRPSKNPPSTELFSRWLGLQYQLEAALLAANGLDLARIKVASPVSRLLRISLGMWFAALIAHERNHIAQAEAVRAAVGFPI